MWKPSILGVLPVLFSCAQDRGNQPAWPTSRHTVFTEITQEANLDFIHDPGEDGSYFMPEIMGWAAPFWTTTTMATWTST